MEISKPDRKLINEGAIQYFDALRALREFRELVLKLCADVVQSRAEGLAEAMKTPIDIDTAYDEIWPDKNEQLLKQHWRAAWIGRRLRFPDFGNAYWGIICEPEGARSDEAIVVAALVGYETNNNAIRDRALPRFREAGVATIVNLDGKEVGLREKLNTGEIDRFPEMLDSMTDNWIRIWHYVGGIPCLDLQSV